MNKAAYTPGDVARLLKLPEKRVREFLDSGLVGQVLEPQGNQDAELGFQDIVVLRLAMGLLADGLPPSGVLRALTALRNQLPADKPLSSITVFTSDGKVVASDGERTWEPETGQSHLLLTTPPESRDDSYDEEEEEDYPEDSEQALAPLVEHLGELGDISEATYWFEIGLALESNEPHRAYDAYLHALACNPEHLDVHINIGRLAADAGDLERAAAYFRQAIRIQPTHPIAYFNLAVTLHDMGEEADAERAYVAALHHDPDFADAHFSLATLLEQDGRNKEALQHME
ncbi:tetratricopeptide repeat protein, partial [Myxococcota bacterium]|nr:tetratricopeptide repeat protein [Myxococcota bacterium]